MASGGLKADRFHYLTKHVHLLYSIKMFNFIAGRKALQKIWYFANLRSGGYTFQWNKFGPYSEELKYVFDDVVEEDLVLINPTPLSDSLKVQYNMYLSDEGLRILNSVRINSVVRNAIKFSYDLLKESNPREMELLASTHFIVSQKRNIDPEYIYKLLNTLKPGSNFRRRDVEHAIKQLQLNKII